MQATRVALLLPLSGPNAALGQSMLDAAQMALFDHSGDGFELMPRDTRGTPQGAAEAARQAIAEGARLILGPVFAQDVAAVRPIAQNAGVEMLAFTNDQTQAGAGTYVLGLLPADQVTRVVGFARSRGITRFVALAPRNAYGDAVVSALQTAAGRFGGQVAQVERYDANLADFTAAARQVTQAAVQPQALVLAEGGPRARALAAALAANGVDTQRVRLLGTALWDEPGLGQEPALVGGWYAAPAPEQRADVEARFERLYGKKPPRIATLAYDAAALAAILARMGGPAPYTPAALTNPSGFEGVDGLFRLRANGVGERALSVLEITPTGSRVIDPAARTFEVLGQ
jgi:branched-chain amino acid transport system substrate-binding protein